MSLTSTYGYVEVLGQDLPSYHKQLENRIKYMKQLFAGIEQQVAQDYDLSKKAKNEANPTIPDLPGRIFWNTVGRGGFSSSSWLPH